MAEKLTDWAKKGMKQRPIEAKIIEMIIEGLKKAKNPIVSISSGGETDKVSSREEILNLVFNLDEARLNTKNGWIYVVMGQDWDTIADYTVNLEDALKEVNDYIGDNF